MGLWYFQGAEKFPGGGGGGWKIIFWGEGGLRNFFGGRLRNFRGRGWEKIIFVGLRKFRVGEKFSGGGSREILGGVGMDWKNFGGGLRNFRGGLRNFRWEGWEIFLGGVKIFSGGGGWEFFRGAGRGEKFQRGSDFFGRGGRDFFGRGWEFFWRVEIFSGGIEIFSGGVERFSVGLGNFREVEKF